MTEFDGQYNTKRKNQSSIEILKEKNIDMWITFVRESSIIRSCNGYDCW